MTNPPNSAAIDLKVKKLGMWFVITYSLSALVLGTLVLAVFFDWTFGLWSLAIGFAGAVAVVTGNYSKHPSTWALIGAGITFLGVIMGVISLSIS